MPALNYRTAAVAVLAVLTLALVSAAAVLLVRGDDNAPIRVVLPTPEPSPDATAGSVGSSTRTAVEQNELRVYITGGVRNPGVYTLRAGDRLDQVLAAAGGATADAHLEAVNLARRVRDEDHYDIPRLGETPVNSGLVGQPRSSAPSGAPGSAGRLVDLNLASAEELETLPGIGEALSAAIVTYREQNGPFQTVEQITSVPRIGPVTYEKIRDLVTVSGAP